MLKYRPDIDGLRAVSVISVILYHAGLTFISGGFIGVDVFFVISGFLITSIILNELDAGKFSIVSFYERRARRILPPLFLTILITLALSFLFLIPSQIKDVGQSIVATSAFLSNYFFYLETDYFNPFNNSAPLLHTWSLAVEEQFYFIFPILLLVLTKYKKAMLLPVLVLITLISLYAAQKTSLSNPQLSFYSIHTRAWELMLGAICAYLLVKTNLSNALENKRGSKLIEVIALLSLSLIFLSLCIFDKNTLHPSVFTLLPVVASAVLITTCNYSVICNKILSNRLFVYIGLISYGLYLFHNPLFSMIDIYFDTLGDEKTVYKLLLLIPTVAISVFSYRFLEKPIRNKHFVGRTMIFSTSTAFLAVFFVTGFAIHKKNGFDDYFVQKLEASGMRMLVDVPKERALIYKARDIYYPSDVPFDCAGDCKKVLLLGDSFGNDAFLSLSTIADNWDVRYIYLDDECMSEFIALHKQGVKGFECKNQPVNPGELFEHSSHIIVTAKWQESTYLAGLDLARYLKSEYDKPTSIVGSILFTDLASLSVKAWRSNINLDKMPEVTYKYQRWDRVRISDALRALVAQEEDLKWIEKKDFFCNYNEQTCRLFDEQNNPIIWDNAHLTTRAYADYGHFLLKGAL